MAKDEDLQLEEEGGEAGGGKKKLIIIIVALLLLVGIGVGVALFLLGDSDEAPTEEAQVEERKEPIYLAIKPLIVNFQGASKAKFMQVEIELQAYDSDVTEAAEQHMPAIRDRLLTLMASKNFNEMNNRAGKEQLQQEMVTAINEVLMQQAALGQGINAVFYTNFVMQ